MGIPDRRRYKRFSSTCPVVVRNLAGQVVARADAKALEERGVGLDSQGVGRVRQDDPTAVAHLAPPLDRGAAVQESNGIMILAIGSTA